MSGSNSFDLNQGKGATTLYNLEILHVYFFCHFKKVEQSSDG